MQNYDPRVLGTMSWRGFSVMKTFVAPLEGDGNPHPSSSASA